MASNPWNSTLPTLLHLQNCKTQRDINQIHARIIVTGILKNTFLTTKLIHKLSSSPHKPLTQFARYLFLSQNPHQTHLWNLIIKSFSRQKNNPKETILLFVLMLCRGIYVDKFTFSIVLKALSNGGLFREGLQVQGLILKSEFRFNVFLGNSIINLYLKCGCIEFARVMFDRMLVRDSVSWNLMINGYAKYGAIEVARELFDQMPKEERNLITWNSMISAYVQLEGGLKFAWELFGIMPERDMVSWNVMIDGCVKRGKLEVAYKLFSRMPRKDAVSWASMIDGYGKIGRVEEARCLFDKIPGNERDVITWNALMSGYVQNGFCVEAVELFHDMISVDSCGLAPDQTTLMIILSAIAELGHIGEGKLIHEYIEKNGLPLDGKLGVALIDMYSKCGSIRTAMSLFRSLSKRSVDHWNAIIGGLAVHGLGETAVDLFMEMQRLSVKPDDITFIGVLNACNHAGMVKEGFIFFDLMRRVHSTSPKLQHYGCMVDILGRAGYLEEAMKLIDSMPIEPNDVVWRALLSACKKHDSIDVGIKIATKLMESGFWNSSGYVILSNLYAASGRWKDVSRIRLMMKENNVRKVRGCSWIELEGTVHEFAVGDKSHPQAQEIYTALNSLNSFIS